MDEYSFHVKLYEFLGSIRNYINEELIIQAYPGSGIGTTLLYMMLKQEKLLLILLIIIIGKEKDRAVLFISLIFYILFEFFRWHLLVL